MSDHEGQKQLYQETIFLRLLRPVLLLQVCQSLREFSFRRQREERYQFHRRDGLFDGNGTDYRDL